MEVTVSKKNQKEEVKKPKVVLLKDLGPQLPLGVLCEDGSYDKTIEVKRWTAREELELGELREENKDSSMPKYITMVLASMCTRIGPWDFEKMKPVEKHLKISQMFAGDVLYLYCWLRYKSLGGELVMKLTCPNCDKDFDYNFDIENIEVKCGNMLEEFQWEYKLRDPFKIRDKKNSGFLMGPHRWNALETLGSVSSPNTGEVKLKVIHSNIQHLLDSPEVKIISEKELLDLTKIDLETLITRIDNDRLGPDMSFETKCKCRRKFTRSIKWEFDDFFGVSSH